MAPAKSDAEKLSRLTEKINEAKGKGISQSSSVRNPKNISYAWRMVLELVIGMLIGIVIGYTIDYFLSTEPWFLIIMSLFGFSAGVRVMIRTAAELTRSDKEVEKEREKDYGG